MKKRLSGIGKNVNSLRRERGKRQGRSLGFMLLICVIMLGGCGKAGSQKVVEKCFNCIEENNLEGLRACISGNEDLDQAVTSEIEDEGEENFMLDLLESYVAEHPAELTYEIVNVSEEKDYAVVTAEVEYNNAGPLMKLALNTMMSKVVETAFTGVELGDEDLSALMASALEKELENTVILRKKETLDIKCIRVEGEWKLDDVLPLINIYFCNMFNTLSEFSEEDISSSEVETEMGSDVDFKETENQTIEKSDSNVGEEYGKTVQYTAWDESMEVLITLNYVSDTSGSFSIKLKEYDEDGNLVLDEEGSGIFEEDENGNGILYEESGEEIGITYQIYYETDHFEMNMEGKVLLEANYAYSNVG